MPYNKDNKAFNDSLDQALRDENIMEGMNKTDIPLTLLLPQLKTSIQGKKKEIWDAAAREIAEADNIEAMYRLKLPEADNIKATYQLKQEELKKLYPSYSGHPYGFLNLSYGFLNLLPILLFLIIGLMALLAISYVASGFFLGWTTVFRWLVSHLGLVITWVLLITPFILCTFLYLLNRLLDAKRKRIVLEYKREQENLRQEYEQKKKDLGMDTLEENYGAADKLVKQAVQKEILRELRLAINTRLKPSYKTSLPAMSAPELAEVFDPAYEHEVSTESKKQLLRRIKNMASGSIGIAGPRGAGKTTLLRSLRFSSKELQPGRPTLSVLIPAPVEYGARDFILLIFSEICSRVLELETATIRPPWASLNELHQSSVENHPGTHFLHLIGAKSIRTSALISIIAGIVLIVVSMFLINALPTSVDTSTPSISTQSPTTPTSSTSSNTSSSSKVTNTTNILATYLTALEITPSTLFPWGVLLAICGGIGFLISKNLQKKLLEDDKKRKTEEHYEKDQKKKEREKIPLVVAQAWEQLDNIKFQQSYSSGWSGSLQLPLALSGSINSAVSLAQYQLSLPEIIERYRQFLKVVTVKYTVVIAIDEMDKLESDEKAERFLNEIKVLFGLPYCFYLISISESAMSSFERRGVPFRDVFDSSFDSIISVDYLNFQTADLLLKKRVIDLPIPFVALCFCLSGGLARDLIRRCRDLLERVQTTPTENTLAKLCRHLIASDIQLILRASIIAAKKSLSEMEMDQFFEVVNELEEERAGSLFLSLKSIANLLHNTTKDIRQELKPNEADIKQRQTNMPQTELGAYLYYAITLLEYFTSKTDTAEWKAAEDSNDFDHLARIRQYFSISLHGACKMISEFRKKQGWEFL